MFQVGDKVRYRDGLHPLGYMAALFTYKVVGVEPDGYALIHLWDQGPRFTVRCSTGKLQKVE